MQAGHLNLPCKRLAPLPASNMHQHQVGVQKSFPPSESYSVRHFAVVVRTKNLSPLQTNPSHPPAPCSPRVARRAGEMCEEGSGRAASPPDHSPIPSLSPSPRRYAAWGGARGICVNLRLALASLTPSPEFGRKEGEIDGCNAVSPRACASRLTSRWATQVAATSTPSLPPQAAF